MPDQGKNILSIILRFLVDRGSQEEAKRAVKQVTQETTNLGQAAAEAGRPTKMTLEEVLEMADTVEKFQKDFNVSQARAIELLSMTQGAWGNNAKQIREVVDWVAEYRGQMKSAEKESRGMGPRFGQTFLLGVTGFTLALTGRQIQRLGRMILDLPGKYAQYAGLGSEAAQEWLDASHDIERSVLRIGRAMMAEVLPIMERVASFAEKVADMIESNPELAEMATKFAIGAVSVGSLLMLTGSLMAAAAAGINLINLLRMGVTKLMAAQIAGGVATAAAAGGTAAGGAAAAGGVGGFLAGLGGRALGGLRGLLGGLAALILSPGVLVGAGGLGLGAIGAGALGRLQEEKLGRRITATIPEALSAGAYGLGQIFGGPEMGLQWGQAVARFMGALKDLEDQAEKTATAVEDLEPPAEAILAYRAHLLQLQEAEEDYQKNRARIIDQYNQNVLDLEKEYLKSREDIIKQANDAMADAIADYARRVSEATRDFQIQQQRAEEDYFRRRLSLAKDYGRDAERAEIDLQIKLRQLRRDHEERMEDLIAARDALGIVREIRRYRREQEEAAENFREQQRRREEDYADRLEELDEQYRIERERRLQDYELRMSDMRQDHLRRMAEIRRQKAEELLELRKQLEERRQELKDQRDEELEALKTGYDDLIESLQKNFVERIRGIDASLLSDYQAYQRHLLDISSTFQSTLNDYIRLVGASLLPEDDRTPKQFGGYAPYGLYQLGEEGEEFVLRTSTTRALEKLAGGRLSQQRVLDLLSGKFIRATTNVQMDITGALSEGERKLLRRDVGSQITESLREVFGVT